MLDSMDINYQDVPYCTVSDMATLLEELILHIEERDRLTKEESYLQIKREVVCLHMAIG